MDVTTSTLQVNTPDGKMETFEARPKEGGAHPAVLGLMEAFGLNHHIKNVTERIAREGYVAIAPDLYHREPERLVPYSELQKAVGIMNRLQDDKIMSDVGAVITHLKAQNYVKAGSIGVTRLFMGARFTPSTPAPHNKDRKGACPFSPGGAPLANQSPPPRTGEINAPIYLFLGGKDPLIPADHVAQMNKALTDNHKTFMMKLYPDATHGFFCDERQSYNPDAAKDAWEKFKSFFAQHLK